MIGSNINAPPMPPVPPARVDKVLRDEFAIAALPSCIGVLAAEGNLTQIGAAESAYAFADAMLIARGKS